MMRIKEIATGKLVWVGEEDNLAAFDPHLAAIWRGTYGKHNLSTFGRYIDAKGWQAEFAAIRLTEEDRRYIEAHKNDLPKRETKYSD